MSVHCLYEIGDEIEYQTFTGSLRRVIVTNKERDIKNGKPGFDGYLTTDPTYHVWGYETQIVTIVNWKEHRTA